MLLPDHILIQTCLDLMRCGYILDIDGRRGILFLFLHLLTVRNPPVSLQIRQVHKTKLRETAPLRCLLRILLLVRIIQHPIIVELIYRSHGLVHTVRTDTDMVGHLNHLARLALRSAADKAHILEILLRLLPILAGFLTGILRNHFSIIFSLIILEF